MRRARCRSLPRWSASPGRATGPRNERAERPPIVNALEINMTETTSGSTVRIVPYTVTDVAGHVPVVLNDFIGATTVSLKGDDQECRLRGSGRRAGLSVEFHEKEPASADGAALVWKIFDKGDGHIVAEPPAS